MVALTVETPARNVWAYDRPRVEPKYWYAMYGAHVRSDVPLPFAPVSSPPDVVPAWEFRLADPSMSTLTPDEPPDAQIVCCDLHRTPTVTVHHRREGAIVSFPRYGTFRIAPDGRRVDLLLRPDADERSVGLVLAGGVSVMAMHQLGYPTLHASAVVSDWGALAFVGHPGQGKSSLCASLLARGARLLADDALPLWSRPDGIYGAPSMPLMKLWPDAAECTLGLSALPNMVETLQKKLVDVEGSYPFADSPARLRALYLVDRYEPIGMASATCTIRPLAPREAVLALLLRTSARVLLSPLAEARALQIYARLVKQIPVSVLSYPSGFEHQEAVYETIEDHLAS
jgi:hypothetical protein